MKQGCLCGREQWGVILWLILISALTYLPIIFQIGYLNDDWHLMYSARAYGTKAFIGIFSVDRLARADLGGGGVRTLTHPLDYLRFLISEVDSIWSFNGHVSPLELDVEDMAEIGIKFSKGAIGGVHLNYIHRPPRHTLEIVGTQGKFRWDNADGVLNCYKFQASFGSYSDDPPAPVIETISPPEGFERNQLFVSQMRHFIDIAQGAAEPVCTLGDGIRALELALAAAESRSTGSISVL
jgi:predicted dehydrogenase